MQQAMQAAFAGLEVEVDDTLTQDYEFRERPMSLEEIMEEEISKEEKQEADPKNALTFVVPLALSEEEVAEDCWNKTYLAVRVENNVSRFDVIKVIKATKPSTTGSFPDCGVHVSATIGALKAALKKGGINVLSISEADGLTLLADH